MRRPQDIDFSRLDYAALDNAQRARVLQLGMERGHIERSLVLWRTMAAVAAGFRRMMATPLEWYAACHRRRRRQSAAATLYALPDRTLKDIGVVRSDIDRVVMTGRRAARCVIPKSG